MSIQCKPRRASAIATLAITLGVLGGGASRDAAAVQLFRYDFTTNTDPSSVVSGMTATPITASNLTTNVASGVYQTSNYSPTIDTSKYSELTASANAGNVLNMSSLAFTLEMLGDQPAAVVASVRTSIDNYASSVYSKNVSPGDFFFNESIDLSGAQYQGLSSITFRYYGTSSSSATTLNYDAVNVNGAVVVPEPATFAMAVTGAAGGACLILRRRKQL